MASSVAISAPNAVLGIPRDAWGINAGVTEAADSTCSCTGWVFDHGDGVKKDFELPSLVSSLTTLYRRDWQGNVALSASVRTNVCLRSEDLSTTWTTHTGTLSVTSTTLTDTDTTVASSRKQQIAVANDSLKRWASVVVAKNAPNLVMVRFALTGGTANSTAIVFDTVTGAWGTNYNYGYRPLPSDVIIKDLGDNGWMVSLGLLNNGTGNTTAIIFLYPAVATTLVEFELTAVVVSLTGSAGFTKMQLEQSTFPTSYIPTTSVPVTLTDYTASGTTLTLAEAPDKGSDLSVDADLLPHSSLSFGGK